MKRGRVIGLELHYYYFECLETEVRSKQLGGMRNTSVATRPGIALICLSLAELLFVEYAEVISIALQLRNLQFHNTEKDGSMRPDWML